MIVVPSLRQRLIDTKLGQLRSAMPTIAEEVSRTEPFDFVDFLAQRSVAVGPPAYRRLRERQACVDGPGTLAGGPFADSNGRIPRST